jgi:hypothetical protein
LDHIDQSAMISPLTYRCYENPTPARGTGTLSFLAHSRIFPLNDM